MTTVRAVTADERAKAAVPAVTVMHAKPAAVTAVTAVRAVTADVRAVTAALAVTAWRARRAHDGRVVTELSATESGSHRANGRPGRQLRLARAKGSPQPKRNQAGRPRCLAKVASPSRAPGSLPGGS